MHLTLFSDYSLRVLMFAALKEDLFQIEEVTSAYGISSHHLAKVVYSLSKLGYLETRRGRGGGVKLASAPEEIRIGKLLRETEQQPPFLECFDPVKNTCVLAGHCRLQGILAEALNNFYSTLNQYTLRDLVSGPHRERMRHALLHSSH
jgi:Rrf2 family transcriptional regulator, nitric oxide-sensitive transcriptional repressor